MKNLTKLFTGMAITFSLSVIATQPSMAETNKFFCGIHNGKQATLVNTPRGNVPLIYWVSGDFAASGWTDEKRCQEVSQRFEEHHINGTLKYIRTGTIKNNPVLCIASSEGGTCPEKNLIVTLKPGTNAETVLQELVSVRDRVAGKPLELST